MCGCDSSGASDLLFDRSCGHGLAYGPVDGLDEPSVPAQADFLGSGVDFGGEVVGQAKVDMFRHGKQNSTCNSNIRSDIVLAMTTIEYALMIDWGMGVIEYIPAKDAEHAHRMAKTIYAGQPCWTVGRETNPWRYVRRSDAELTEEVAR